MFQKILLQKAAFERACGVWLECEQNDYLPTYLSVMCKAVCVTIIIDLLLKCVNLQH